MRYHFTSTNIYSSNNNGINNNDNNNIDNVGDSRNNNDKTQYVFYVLFVVRAHISRTL